MTQQERAQLIDWTKSLSVEDTHNINTQAPAGIFIWVSPRIGPRRPHSWGIGSYLDLLDKATRKDLAEVAEAVSGHTNSLIIVGVRADKSKRKPKT